jgi:hypothetical protein
MALPPTAEQQPASRLDTTAKTKAKRRRRTANNSGANVKTSGIKVNNGSFLQPEAVLNSMSGSD